MDFSFLKKINIASALIVVSTLVIYIATSYISDGYYFPDEHFQILEFSALKMGNSNEYSMAWEYGEKIRPTLQVAIVYLTENIGLLFGITNKHIIIIFLRLLSALLSIGAMLYFLDSVKEKIPSGYRNLLLFTTLLLFFQPYLSVRFSSETYSNIFFLFAAGVIFKRDKIKNWIIVLGLLLGFSFLFRFQSAFFAFGVGLWLLVIQRRKYIELIKLVVAFCVVVVFGVLVDTWYYGEFVFTPYNYFHANIVLDIASKFGVSPWYFYFEYLFEFPVFGILILSSFLIFLIRKYKDPVLWAILPFFLAHILTPHKEGRFLFPLVGFAGYFIVLAIIEVDSIIRSRKSSFGGLYKNKIVIALFILFLLMNFIGLLFTSTYRNNNGFITALKVLSFEESNENKILFVDKSNPYSSWLPLAFYKDSVEIKNLNTKIFSDLFNTPNQKKYLFLKESERIDNEFFLNKLNPELIHTSIAPWQLVLDKYFERYNHEDVFYLYSLNSISKQSIDSLIDCMFSKEDDFKVSIFSECNFQSNSEGRTIELDSGTYTFEDLQNRGFAADVIGSIMIPEGLKVSIKNGENLLDLNKSVFCMNPEYKDVTNSILKIEHDSTVKVAVLFQDIAYLGERVFLGEGEYDSKTLEKISIKKNNLSSLILSEGFEAVLYEKDSAEGKRLVVRRDINDLNQASWNNATASITIRKAQKEDKNYVYVDFDCNTKNMLTYLEKGRYNLPMLESKGIKNDDLSAIKVDESMEVELYEHIDFKGESVIISGKSLCLSEIGWDNRATSLIIRKK
ncbi:MAG: hypothetical protein IPO21_07425 [Bacteroidales bacterium]|nr:hypothetical protein [Bacteroidales bacterium]